MSLKRILLALFISVFTSLFIFAQAFDLESAKIEEFLLKEDSNVRKWDAFIQQAEGKLTFFGLEVMDLDLLSCENFYSLTLTIPVNQITSKNSLLIRNTHNKLKVNEFSSITFSLGEVISITKEQNRYITALGTIVAAGYSHHVNLLGTAEITTDGNWRFSGTNDMLMTDFNITPPTAILGIFRLHDEILVRFNVTITPTNLTIYSKGAS